MTWQNDESTLSSDCFSHALYEEPIVNIHLRKEQSDDIEEIDELIIAAFLEAPHTSHTEQFIVKQLRDAEALSTSIVAELGERIVGHVALSRVEISDGSAGWYGLGPISVDPEMQGRGIGSQLMCEAERELRNIQANGCVLLGEPEYYRRFGFKAIDRLILPDVPPEYFLALHLDGTIPRGVVTYHKAFSAVD